MQVAYTFDFRQTAGWCAERSVRGLREQGGRAGGRSGPVRAFSFSRRRRSPRWWRRRPDALAGAVTRARRLTRSCTWHATTSASQTSLVRLTTATSRGLGLPVAEALVASPARRLVDETDSGGGRRIRCLGLASTDQPARGSDFLTRANRALSSARPVPAYAGRAATMRPRVLLAGFHSPCPDSEQTTAERPSGRGAAAS